MPRASLRSLVLALVLSLTVVFHYASRSNSTTLLSVSQRLSPIPAAKRLKDARCSTNYPDNVVLVVKTGATEAYEKLPTQLLTVLQCANNLLLFSDLEQDIGPYHLHDSLAKMPTDAMNNSDFDIYKAMQSYQAEGRDIRELNQMMDLRETTQTSGHNAAWALDKYKFLYTTERAWELAPGRDWYVFVEADTYLVWANLLRWLHTFDADEKLFLGRGVPMHEEGQGFYFGHGGSGYVMSRAAMYDYAVDHAGLASRWDYRVPDMWFGDYVQAKALKEELDLSLTDAWPLLNRDEIATIPWGNRTWCEQVVTLHHVRPDEVQAIWNYEQRRHANANAQPPPLIFAELFKGFVTDSEFASQRDEWDNLSNDQDYQLELPKLDFDANLSPDSCALACSVVDSCMQWSHLTFAVSKVGSRKKVGGACYLSHVFRIGEERSVESWADKKEKTDHTWVSGWRSDRIERWLETVDCGVQ